MTAALDLAPRTLLALDWPVILERLAYHCRTYAGARAARAQTLASDLGEVRRRFAVVDEILGFFRHLEDVPVGAVGDVGEVAERAGRGVVLEARELQDVGSALRGLWELRRFIEARGDRAPALRALGEPIRVDPELLGRLESAFTPQGDLDEASFPELAALRRNVRALKERVRASLEEMLKSQEFADLLQDRFVTEREGRFVLPIKVSRRAGVGIVHDTSQSGETAFVEPASLVEPQNELRELAGALKREERRILVDLSLRVGRCAAEILASLGTAASIDVAVAAARLGTELDGWLPTVGEEGVIDLAKARHPVLVLRGVAVVANDFHLDSVRPGLVLTGPNTGGKTVALKTLGLAALFVRAGIPFPAAEGSRVDLFAPVLADVGDLQAVEQDLSTFSGHVLVLDAVLGLVGPEPPQSPGPRALVLLDELAVGTEPLQGAALARAVLEELARRGAAVVVTTHYGELKLLSLDDPRFLVAGVSYVGGRPTYRFQPGVFGQSHALSVARRLGLPDAVLHRAEELLGQSGRAYEELSRRLEIEIDTARNAAADAQERGVKATALAAWEQRLAIREKELKREIEADFRRRLREQEKEVRRLVAALQADPDLARAGRTLEEIRRIREERLGGHVEAAPPPPAEVEPGDRVSLPGVGRQGRVVELASGGRVLVDLGGMRTWTRVSELARAPGAAATVPVAPVVLPEKEELRSEHFGGLPTEANRIDLRGLRADEALEAVETFLDKLVQRNEPVAFLLHGHGTGALKTAIREWLPHCRYAKRWRPGEEGEGGDAFTIVDLG
jgi:DNA mismatch repair protein MutS2